MWRITFIVSVLLCVAPATRAGEVRLWHSMSGVRGAELERLVERFNRSQPQVRVAAAYKGAYDEAVLEAVMGRSSKNFAARAPHLVQASELGSFYLREQKDAALALWQVLAEAKVAFAADTALASAEELLDERGRLLALPFGRSTPVLYYNRDAFRI